MLEDGYTGLTFMYSFPQYGWHWLITHWISNPRDTKRIGDKNYALDVFIWNDDVIISFARNQEKIVAAHHCKSENVLINKNEL